MVVPRFTTRDIRKLKDISFPALETEIFKSILRYMGVADNLVLLLGPFDHTFMLHSIRSIHMKFELNWVCDFRGEDI